MCHAEEGRNHEEGNGTIVQPFVDSIRNPVQHKVFFFPFGSFNNIISKVGLKKGRSGDSAHTSDGDDELGRARG